MATQKLSSKQLVSADVSWYYSRKVRTRLAHSLSYLVILAGAIVISFPFF